MHDVRALVARYKDYVLVDWEPAGVRQREYAMSWIPVENISTAVGSNSLTSLQGWFESLPEMGPEEAALYRGLGA